MLWELASAFGQTAGRASGLGNAFATRRESCNHVLDYVLNNMCKANGLGL
jgi:hypothetical protein